jgi:hypothetical protein
LNEASKDEVVSVMTIVAGNAYLACIHSEVQVRVKVEKIGHDAGFV